MPKQDRKTSCKHLSTLSPMTPILITGSNGLLGQKLVKLFLAKGINFLATSFGANRNPDCPENQYVSLDVTDKTQVDSVLEKTKPSAVIHTAAMTNVDQCESDHEGCDKLNVDAVQYLWEASKKYGIHFQLLSTDFVFDGEKGNYTENDTPAPLSYYGHSKYKAEQILTSDSNTNWSIVRTIIVYGTGHNLSRSNLVLWALDAIPKGQEMKIVDDQFRAPTWADDLALGCYLVIKNKEQGIFHISGPETKSILEWVHYIGKHFGWSTENVIPISSSTLNQAAKRPPKTGFDLTKSRELLGYKPKKMSETLDELIKQLDC
jgi:dTDP-4-dehydrorhamnose reductase